MEQRFPQGLFRREETQLRPWARKLPSNFSPDPIDSHFDPHSEGRFFDSTPGPEFYQLDTAPTPSDDFLIQKLLGRKSHRYRKKRAQDRLLSQIESSLKDGTHEYMIWRSTADDIANTQHYIYLTVDSVVYPLIGMYRNAGTALYPPKRVLNSPVVAISDAYAVALTNMGWKSGQFYYQGNPALPRNAQQMAIATESWMVPIHPYLPPEPIDGNYPYDVSSWWCLPLRELLGYIGNTATSASLVQEYLNAAESANAEPENLYAETTDYRNVQGWKMQFAYGFGVMTPVYANVSLQHANIPLDKGMLLYEINYEGTQLDIPVVGQGARLVHYCTLVDLEWMIHSFEGKEEKEFKNLPFRSDFRIHKTMADVERFIKGDLLRWFPGMKRVGALLVYSLNLYWFLPFDKWREVYNKITGSRLPDMPSKKNRPGSINQNAPSDDDWAYEFEMRNS